MRHLSRRVVYLPHPYFASAKGSGNRKKLRIKVARSREKIGNQRSDFLHKLSRRLVNENQVISLEGLVVGNMVRNRCLAKSISKRVHDRDDNSSVNID